MSWVFKKYGSFTSYQQVFDFVMIFRGRKSQFFAFFPEYHNRKKLFMFKICILAKKKHFLEEQFYGCPGDKHVYDLTQKLPCPKITSFCFPKIELCTLRTLGTALTRS